MDDGFKCPEEKQLDELGEVFNIENNQCDAPENVADWYILFSSIYEF